MPDPMQRPTTQSIFSASRTKRSDIARLRVSTSPSREADTGVVGPISPGLAKPPPAFEASSSEVVATCESAAPAVDDDDRFLSILAAPLWGEPTSVAFARKERELRDGFAQLAILAARALHKRLANPAEGDRLATQFARLTAERQHRLLQFLADARRRAAVAGRR